MSSFPQPADFLAESRALAELLEPLADADFERRTQFKDYSVHDVVAHLHAFNWAADLALRDGEAFQSWWRDFAAGLGPAGGLPAATDAWLEGARGRPVFERWRDFLPGMAERFAAADPRARVPWVGPEMSVRSSITARLMETWAHGQELYDLLGVVRVDADRIRNIAHLGVSTFAWSFAVRGEQAPGPPPHVELRAPSGATWEWNSENASDRVAGSATEFCQVVTQTRNVADTELAVSGPVARRWMSLAQCFAGGVSEPPAPGTRFTAGSR